MADRPLYFDNNATTFPAPEAVEAALPLLGEFYGNPSSPHSFGQKVRHEIELARETVARMLNCAAAEVVFNSGGTEGNNTALYAALQARPERKHIITTRVEHSSVLQVVRSLAGRGYRASEINVDRQGHVDLDELKNEISGDTAVVSCLWANNETGVVNPIGAIGDLAKQFGALFHVDAVQCPGKRAIDLAAQPAIDLLTLSGHKFHALKGAGALFVRKGVKLEPFLRGGHQEGGLRGGTENVLGIVSMGAAARLVLANLDRHIEHMRILRDRLQVGLLTRIPDVQLNGDAAERLPNTVNAGFRYVDGEALLMMLDAENIACTAGSACRSGSMEPSHVLQAMRVPLNAIHGSVRFCLSRHTTREEVDTLVEKLARIVARLREMSPFAREPRAKAAVPDLEAHKAFFARV